MPWREISPTDDASGDGTTVLPVRVFRVWGVSKAAIVLTPGDILNAAGEPLPSYGDSHPNYASTGGPSPKLDRYDVRSDNNSPLVWYATARFSPDGRFRFGLRSLPDEFLALGGDATPLDVKIPIAIRTHDYGPDKIADGQWKPAEYRILSHAERYIARVTVDAAEVSVDVRNFISEQVNSLHELTFRSGSRKVLQFAGARYSQKGADKMEISYEWLADPGSKMKRFTLTPAMFGPAERGGLGPFPIKLYPDDMNPFTPSIPPGGFEFDMGGGRLRKFLRPPFHRLEMLIPADTQLLPIWTPQPMADDFDRSAWTNFPGLL
jgi:hypothetical protein